MNFLPAGYGNCKVLLGCITYRLRQVVGIEISKGDAANSLDIIPSPKSPAATTSIAIVSAEAKVKSEEMSQLTRRRDRHSMSLPDRLLPSGNLHRRECAFGNKEAGLDSIRLNLRNCLESPVNHMLCNCSRK